MCKASDFSIHEAVYFTVIWVIFAIATGCSLILLSILYNMAVWNDYTILIFSMTCGQLIYDICFIHHALYLCGDEYYVASLILDLIGISGAYICYVLSNIISFSVVYMLVQRAVFNFKRYARLILAILIVPIVALIVASCYAVIVDGEVSNNRATIMNILIEAFVILRIIPIALNVVFMIVCYYYTSYVYRSKDGQYQTVHEKSISILVGRLKWYPILQVCNRLFPFWYDLQFPNIEDDGYKFDSYNHFQYTLNMLGVVSPIIAPIGFLFVYLYMYPRAYFHVKLRLNSAASSINSGFNWISSGSSSSFAPAESSKRDSNLTSSAKSHHTGTDSNSTSSAHISEFRESEPEVHLGNDSRSFDFVLRGSSARDKRPLAAKEDLMRGLSKERKSNIIGGGSNSRESTKEDARESSRERRTTVRESTRSGSTGAFYREFKQQLDKSNNIMSFLNTSEINWRNIEDEDLVLMIIDDKMRDIKVSTASSDIELNQSPLATPPNSFPETDTHNYGGSGVDNSDENASTSNAIRSSRYL